MKKLLQGVVGSLKSTQGVVRWYGLELDDFGLVRTLRRSSDHYYGKPPDLSGFSGVVFGLLIGIMGQGAQPRKWCGNAYSALRGLAS